ncbi:MAG: hypothetical protein AAF958_08760 [Planctomycetota bacterium]
MSAETTRRVGAITGLVLGIAVMYAIGKVGLIPAFFLGAGGCVAGAMVAERVHASRNQDLSRDQDRLGETDD